MEDYIQRIEQRALSWQGLPSLEPLIEKIKDRRIVMLGEATHGTHEFYEWRRLLTKELIQNHGFSFVAVEGDWPAVEKIHQAIAAGNSLPPTQVLSAFSRWPTWMWANTDISRLIEDLRELNSSTRRKIGFHGLDVYSLFESADEVIAKLQLIDPQLAQWAKDNYSCFEPFRQNEMDYVRSLLRSQQGCQTEVSEVLQQALSRRLENTWQQDAALFDAIQNARIVHNAEKYYRSMITGAEDSWNIRDQHMLETLKTLLDHYGPGARAIVWAHNTHIGDYRATDMLISGQVNLGGLARQEFGEEQVFLIGQSSYQGSVIASHAWDGPMEVMNVPMAKEGSVEHLLHQASLRLEQEDFYLILEPAARETSLNQYCGQRAIGVVYHPESEKARNYVPTRLASRYDAFMFFDHSRALIPYRVEVEDNKIPDTYPFGERI